MSKTIRKILAVVLALSMLLCFAACKNKSDDKDTETKSSASYGSDKEMELAKSGVVSTMADQIKLTGDPTAIKIGVILVGDENESYTAAHINGIKEAAKALGIPDKNIVWKYSIAEDETCYDTANELANDGCNLVIANSYGHQSYIQQAAKDNPKVQFVNMTGDTAISSGLDNLNNAFTDVYESRYVSGVVAGLKIQELVNDGKLSDKNYDKDGNVLIGYVGAYPYAEVVSGYTAFYLGIKSVYPKVSMEVSYTNSWFNITAEGEAANKLISDGCVIIGQHADSTGAPAAVQAANKKGTVCYSVGYNIDMLSAAPDAALTSATNNWEVYYEYAFKTVINGDKLDKNWCAGYEDGAVAITALGSSCADGTADKVAEVIAGIKDGSIKVFDTSSFTISGKNITWAYATDSDGDFNYDCNNVISDGYYHESYVQSAPSFALRIDGITELNAG